MQTAYGMSMSHRFILVHQQLKRQGHAASSQIAPPSYVEISTTQALEDAAYCEQRVKRGWLYRVFSEVFFLPPKQYIREAAALSSIVSHGLCDRNTPWSEFTTQGLYDPRLFMYIWRFITNDTLPNLERDDKRKKKGEEDDDDGD